MDSSGIDRWLAAGGVVIAASDRAARALERAYHRRRRAQGLDGWPAPAIRARAEFTRAVWEERTLDGRMLLSPAQEHALWVEIVGEGQGQLATLLEGSRHRLAEMAAQAHELLAGYAPELLRPAARAGWDGDRGAFSAWLTRFDEACHDHGYLSAARAPLELLALLEEHPAERPPLLAAGFDRMTPVERRLFEAWGRWQRPASDTTPGELRFYRAADRRTELEACARWSIERLAADPEGRLLVVAQQIEADRGAIERALLSARESVAGARESGVSARSPLESQHPVSGDPLLGGPLFEFSLGTALGQVPLARAALLLLRWLDGALAEHELDWLFSSGLSARGPGESLALQRAMRILRHRSLARTVWTLEEFTAQGNLPAGWTSRMRAARARLLAQQARPHSPLDWAGLIEELLVSAGLPGRELSSARFQAWRRWQQALETAGSLAFDGRRTGWGEMLSSLTRIVERTLYAPVSADAPIQIAGPAESAGLGADAVWFLGADEDHWPASGRAHPFLPLAVQRESGMPHASPDSDRELAAAITGRLTGTAPEIVFSFAGQVDGADTRPSRLITGLAGPPGPLPAHLAAAPFPAPAIVAFCDRIPVPCPPGPVRGGSHMLTAQSSCPFRAFALHRLGAEGWKGADFALSAAERGQLLHAVLDAVWSGPPGGLGSRDDIVALPDREAFVAGHVRTVFAGEMPRAARHRLPLPYLELEALRLTRLITAWLAYEAARPPFTVVETEATHNVTVAGVEIRLRLDRLDRLADGSPMVVDYKTGPVSRRRWDLPRPDDVQLPLYAGFALNGEEPGGLVFARLRAGQLDFDGYLRDPESALPPASGRTGRLRRERLTPERMSAWRACITALGESFVGGGAAVDPRDYPRTCEGCDLQAVCRVHESRPGAGDEEGESDDE